MRPIKAGFHRLFGTAPQRWWASVCTKHHLCERCVHACLPLVEMDLRTHALSLASCAELYPFPLLIAATTDPQNWKGWGCCIKHPTLPIGLHQTSARAWEIPFPRAKEPARPVHLPQQRNGARTRTVYFRKSPAVTETELGGHINFLY